MYDRIMAFLQALIAAEEHKEREKLNNMEDNPFEYSASQGKPDPDERNDFWTNRKTRRNKKSWFNEGNSGPEYMDGRSYYNQTHNKANGWIFNSGYAPHRIQPYNADSNWRSLSTDNNIKVSFTSKGTVDSQFIEVIDHYNETHYFPVSLMIKAMRELSDEKQLEIQHSAESNMLMAQVFVKYCIKNALICHQLEEINI